jgi:acyl-CoA synthetase (AMP-forming)/AMP-acid ligase II
VEVENAIYKIEGIREAVIVGIPDVMLGESIIAFVTIHDLVILNEKDIQRECMARLEGFMVPQKIIILPEMPKSSNGKIDKSELKKLL